MSRSLPRPLRAQLAAVGLSGGLLVLAACGGSSDATGTAGTGASASAVAAPPGGVGFPGAAGLVAAIDGSTMQVQSRQSGQVAVSWTGGTTFTRTVTASVDDVLVGSCVTVRGDGTGAGASVQADKLTATTVTVSEPVDGDCSPDGWGGGRQGSRPAGVLSGMTSGRPSGAPSGAPSRGPGSGGTGVRPVSGEVTGVDGATLTVAAIQGGPQTDSSATSTTTDVTVTTTGSTTYTKTVDGTADDLAVGQCVTAVGEADDTGAVTATSISSRPATDGQCDLGPGGAVARGGASGGTG